MKYLYSVHLQTRSSARCTVNLQPTKQHTHDMHTKHTLPPRPTEDYGVEPQRKRSLQVISCKQMSFESSFERCRRLNVTDTDIGGSIRKRTLSKFAFSDVGYVENSWIRGGMELSRRRVGSRAVHKHNTHTEPQRQK